MIRGIDEWWGTVATRKVITFPEPLPVRKIFSASLQSSQDIVIVTNENGVNSESIRVGKDRLFHWNRNSGEPCPFPGTIKSLSLVNTTQQEAKVKFCFVLT